VFDFLNWNNLWPLLVVGVGLAFFVGMVLGGKQLGGLAVPGSIIITVGLILFVLNGINRWEAWSYAWALIIVGIGIGTLINGYWSDQPNLRKQGLGTIRAGLTLFLIFGILMEFIFSITGESERGDPLLWGILLAVLGLFLLITRIFRLGMAEGERADLFWPVLMTGVGVITSLAYLGWLPEENLLMVLNLWPLLLIAAGLGILFGGRSAWLGALLGVLIVGVIFAAVFAGGQLGLRSQPVWPFETGFIQFGDVGGERIVGSGNIITENRPAGSFDRVSLEIDANLEIQQGAAESLTVSADDNVLPVLITEVSGGELVIRIKPFTSVRPSKSIDIKLTVRDLEEVSFSSSGKVLVHPLRTNELLIHLSSSGNIEFEEIQTDKLTADLSSSGDILVKGTARQLDLDMSSSGSFLADELQVQEAEANLSSSGDATLWVVDNLDVNLSSSGNVSYYGSPRLDQNTSSTGRLIPIGEK
jgi:hypothetical protein